MAKYVTYRCPDCKGEFDYLHHPSDDPPPEHCELCNSYMGDEPQKVPVLKLHIGTGKGKAGDKLFRQMEKSADERIKAAVEMGGGEEKDYAHMKVTDMKDNLREGDTTAPSVTQSIKNLSTPMAKPELQNPQAAAWIGETTAGDGALSTRATINHMQNSGRHLSNVAKLTHAGQMNKA